MSRVDIGQSQLAFGDRVLIWINRFCDRRVKKLSAKSSLGRAAMAKFALGASPNGKMAKRRCNPRDASLLFCCMDVLQIDHDKLARDEPLLYRELQGICALCPNKRDCAFDLTGGFDGIRWDEWWLYCPNAAMLTTIGALQKCRHPPRYNSAGTFSRLQHAKE